MNHLLFTTVYPFKEKINLNAYELIEYVFSIVSGENYHINEQIKNKVLVEHEDNDKLNFVRSFLFKNEKGEKVDVNSLIDIPVDACQELCEFISAYNYKTNKKNNRLKSEEIELYTVYLFHLACFLTNTKQAFEYYLYEYAILIEEEQSVKIKYNPEYYFLRFAGSRRKSNLFTQKIIQINSALSSYKSQFVKWNKPTIKIIGTTLQLENSNIEFDSSIYMPTLLSVFATHYEHLTAKVISSLHSITINQVMDFVVKLQSIFKLVYEKHNKRKTHKIKKNNLIRYLSKATDFDIKTIKRLLKELSQSFSHQMDFWRKPLISYNEYYYFLMPPLAFGQPDILIDRILKNTFSFESRIIHFKRMICTTLPKSIKNNYTFNIIKDETINSTSDKLDSPIIIELKSMTLLLEICLFSSPLSSKDYGNVLTKIRVASNQIEDKKKLFKDKYDSASTVLIGVVITNHPSISGIRIGTNYILDYTLFKNYFVFGKFKLTKTLMNKGEIVRDSSLNNFDYYEDENEFNTNFESFCISPIPIAELIKYYQIKEFPVITGNSNFILLQDGVETLDYQTNIELQKQELVNYFNDLFYFEDELILSKRKDLVEKRIQYVSPQIFDFVAFNKNRLQSIEVLKIFSDFKIKGLSFLIYYLNSKINQLGGIRIKRNVQKDVVCIDSDKAESQLKEILENNLSVNPRVNLHNYKFAHNLNVVDLDNLIGFLIDILNQFEIKSYSEDDLENLILLVSVFCDIANKNKQYEKYVYISFVNVLDIFNHNGFFQRARDLSEEILLYSFTKQNDLLIGWLCMSKCFTKQENIIDATYYGILSLHVLENRIEIEESLITEVLYYFLLLFRDFGFNNIAESLYKTLTSLNLSTYNEQKISLAFFNNKLKSSVEEFITILPIVKEYLKENKDTIIEYGSTGVSPWVVFIYNIKRYYDKGFIADFDFFIPILKELEKHIDSQDIEVLKDTFFRAGKSTKSIFANSLTKILETRHFEDLAHELNKLLLLADNVLQLSLKSRDIDYILLAGVILNDNSLSFKEKELESRYVTPFMKRYEGNYVFENYSAHIFSNLDLKKNQIVCWLLETNNEIYQLTINHEKKWNLKKIDTWKIAKMREWLSQIDDFYFDDKGDYPINQQESDYKKLLEKLSIFQIDLDLESIDELLYIPSISLSQYPHNLLVTFFPSEENYNLHEYLIQEYLLENQLDFLIFHKSITNIISLEWFIENGDDIIFAEEDLTLEAWMPIVDGDMPINISYEKLKPIIVDKYLSKIHTGLLPENEMTAKINIFLAHGSKNSSGFITFYTRETDGGHAYIRREGIETLLGQGEIAILFVCNSAAIQKEAYAQRLSSFIHQVLSIGYKTVIAPAWSLNPDITPIWLEEFIEQLKLECTVGVAVHKANLKVAKKGYNEYHGFYAPSGWAAMHIYGNPNISFR